MIAAHPPTVGISARCMLAAVPLSAVLWAIILTTLAPAPVALACCVIAKENSDG